VKGERRILSLLKYFSEPHPVFVKNIREQYKKWPQSDRKTEKIHSVINRHTQSDKRKTHKTADGQNKLIISRINSETYINNLLKTKIKNNSPIIVGNCGELCNFEPNMLI
jgi:hypothetical protein